MCIRLRTLSSSFEARRLICIKLVSGFNVLLWDLFVCFDFASAFCSALGSFGRLSLN